MTTDPLPRSAAKQAKYLESDRLGTIEVPPPGNLQELAKALEETMETGYCGPVRETCARLAAEAAEFYRVHPPAIRVLAARPLRVREGGWATELFGDYHPDTKVIRIWMRTAVRKQVTSYGTLLSTLCHEFCHHLDFERFGFTGSPHTRGFYERTAVLYHHMRGTPLKQLCWRKAPGGRYRIDWVRTVSRSAAPPRLDSKISR
ncbi:MAG: hypothetical protein KIT09_26775 [Bryobacteraceae bacterium]|nr:hypothetical protein [Bryobacteraceae bacterium]